MVSTADRATVLRRMVEHTTTPQIIIPTSFTRMKQDFPFHSSIFIGFSTLEYQLVKLVRRVVSYLLLAL